MITHELLDQILRLDRADKLRLIETLASSLAAEEETVEKILTQSQYEIWSPYDAGTAAETLAKMLEDEKRLHG